MKKSVYVYGNVRFSRHEQGTHYKLAPGQSEQVEAMSLTSTCTICDRALACICTIV